MNFEYDNSFFDDYDNPDADQHIPNHEPEFNFGTAFYLTDQPDYFNYNVLGITSIHSDLNDGTILDAPIYLNADVFWTPDTFYNVVLHEIGHMLGLGHVNDYSAVMYPSVIDGHRQDLSADDIAGVSYLYGLQSTSQVPKPSSMALLLLGILGLAYIKRTRHWQM